MTDAWRYRVGAAKSDIQAGQPLLIDDAGAVARTEGRPNCVALETIEMDPRQPTMAVKVQMLDAQPPNYTVKVCNCGHSAGSHRSSDDHCNAPGCNCAFPSCGH